LTGEAANSPIRRSDRYALPTKSRNLLPAAPINAPWRTVSPHLATWRSPGFKPERLSTTASCVPLRYALPGPILGGVSKGEGPQSRPFVPRGGMGDGWRPPCFWWGSKGEASLRQRYLPLALTWECPPCGSKENVGCIPHGKAVFPVPEAGTVFCTIKARSKQPSCEMPKSMV